MNYLQCKPKYILNDQKTIIIDLNQTYPFLTNASRSVIISLNEIYFHNGNQLLISRVNQSLSFFLQNGYQSLILIRNKFYPFLPIFAILNPNLPFLQIFYKFIITGLNLKFTISFQNAINQ